ncbi:Vacuolar protein sorting-associated protein 41 [Nymphon striatum]|nr:Vacuolar protein sorting-associated protein 41 [Nymphon striatum]
MEDENKNGDSDKEDYESSSTEDQEEEAEPKLKYERLGNDFPVILRKYAASCIAVHSKFLALGTHWGAIYILDHMGNNVKAKEFNLHDTTVNHVVIDENGDYIASCSNGGRVVIIGLYTTENNITHQFDRPVISMALDPNFNKPGSNRRFITGNDKLILHEKSFLSRNKSTVLYDRDGTICNIKWRGRFVAWACDVGVRVFDINDRKTVSLIQKDHDQNTYNSYEFFLENCRLRSELYRCNLFWKDDRTLLVGWADSVKVCVIKDKLEPDLQLKDLPNCFVEIGMLRKKFGWSRPQVRVLEPGIEDYVDLSTDRLSVKGFQENRPNDYFLDYCAIYNLIFSSISLQEAITQVELMKQTGEELKQHDLHQVGKLYLNHLLDNHCFDEAGKLCVKILGKNTKLWEEEVYRFAKIQQLGAVSPYLPRGDMRLDAAIYEMVLNEFLQTNIEGFHKLIRDWPSDLYSIPTIINAVIDRLVYDPENQLLLQSLGDLYSYEMSYDKALAIYLRLGHADVFQLISKHRLFSSIHDKLEILFNLDETKAITMLLENTDLVPVGVVVKKLNKCPRMVYEYLEKLYQKDKNIGQQYYGLQVRLCAEFAPKKLLSFLRGNNGYPLEEAYEVCEQRHMVPEMVYILARMGNTTKALLLITEDLQDMHYAIEFCKEHDDKDLWEQLIKYTVDKPEFLTVLLNNIGTHVDPIMVIQRIECGMEIPGLQSSLVQILLDYNLQVEFTNDPISLREGCKKILVSDWFNLLDRLHRQQKKGICINEDQVCQTCESRIFYNDPRNAENIVLFYCKHAFHEKCIPAVNMVGASESGSGEYFVFDIYLIMPQKSKK